MYKSPGVNEAHVKRIPTRWVCRSYRNAERVAKLWSPSNQCSRAGLPGDLGTVAKEF